MTLTQFMLLNDAERYVLWLGASVEVASYEAFGRKHILYQLDSIYIEMIILADTPHEATLYLLMNEKMIDPYLERINIIAAMAS